MRQDAFFGRQVSLDILRKRSSGLLDGYRQNIAIIGDELVGKTSLVLKFIGKLNDTRIIPLYFESRPETMDTFARRFIAVFLYNFMSGGDTALKEDLDFLVSRSEKYIPKTAAKIRLILSALAKRKKNEIFTQLLLLCDSLHAETGKFCVIVFDEFQNLEHLGVSGLYREWSRVLMTQKSTMYVIISSSKFRARSILAKNLTLLFGNFEVVNLEPFDIHTTERYLEYRQCYPHLLSTGQRNFLVHFTGGYPFYLEVIADALTKAGKTDLAQLLERILFDSSGILHQRFASFIRRFQDSPRYAPHLSILYLVASGRNKLKDIAHILKIPQESLLSKVNNLLELDVVTRSADFLKVNDRVFGFWLRFVYQEKMRSLTFDAKNQKESFRRCLEALIRECIADAEKPLLQRMTELLRLFQDDTVQIEARKVKLDNFREVKPFELSSKALKDGIICRSQDSLWIMGVKKDPLTENDIIDFSKECKKYRSTKLQRKVIVTLDDIDQNTKLRALEEKIWMWNIRDLNQMFDLFLKPWVVS